MTEAPLVGMSAEDAEEYSESLAQIGEGWWRQIHWAFKQGIPEALGMSSADWRAKYYGHLQLDLEARRDAVKELTDEGATGEEIADVLGVGDRTVDRDRAALKAPDGAESDQEDDFDQREADEDEVDERQMALGDEPDSRPASSRPAPVMLTLRTHIGDEVQYPQPQSKPTFNQTEGDGISWAKWSWNPVTGCLHGCTYCYAREIATSERARASYPVGFTPLFHDERLDAPSNTNIPTKYRNDPAYRRVFVCSMADLYGRWVPDEWITRVHKSMLDAPDWEYLLLTKFPDRYVGLDLPPNAWVGTSVDEQKRVRIAERAFRQIDGVKVKWLSLEPLNGPLEFSDLSMFDWIVIGAQTRTVQPDGVVEAVRPDWRWVFPLLQLADEQGVRVHCKPNLLGRTDANSYPGMLLPNEYPAVMDA